MADAKYSAECLEAFKKFDSTQALIDADTPTDFALAAFAAGWTAGCNECMKIVRDSP